MSGKKLCLFEKSFSCDASCCRCRFTTVAEVLLLVGEQVQKLQDQNENYSSTDASNLPSPVEEIETFTQSLLTKLLAK